MDRHAASRAGMLRESRGVTGRRELSGPATCVWTDGELF